MVVGLVACSAASTAEAIQPIEETQETQETTPVSEEGTLAQPTPYSSERQTSKYNEAPMLAERVAAGELPPVDERLPKHPRVLPVYDQIGQYGGTWRRAYSGLGGLSRLRRNFLVILGRQMARTNRGVH